jgi:hypothetical protein
MCSKLKGMQICKPYRMEKRIDEERNIQSKREEYQRKERKEQTEKRKMKRDKRERDGK